MIDLLINRHTRLPIAAKPAGSKWGRRELDGPNLCVVQLSDEPPELAARVAAVGVVANPFAEYLPADDGAEAGWAGQPVMVRQSAIEVPAADVRCGARVALTDIPASEAGEIPGA